MAVQSGDGAPLTNSVTGDAQLVAYVLPLQGQFLVESVVADIDAAAGAVTAELIVKDKSGAVIARKSQGKAIPAGELGSATWALRLADEESAAVTSDIVHVVTLSMTGTGPLDTAGLGANLPQIRPGNGSFSSVSLAATWTVPAGAGIHVDVLNNDTVPRLFLLSEMTVQLIGAATRERLDGADTSCPPGATTRLPWSTKSSGTTLLDRTIPTTPVFISAGTYAVGFSVLWRF